MYVGCLELLLSKMTIFMMEAHVNHIWDLRKYCRAKIRKREEKISTYSTELYLSRTVNDSFLGLRKDKSTYLSQNVLFPNADSELKACGRNKLAKLSPIKICL